jgi:hypothetical protein
MAALVDDFDDNSIDTGKWPANYGTVTETGGRARVETRHGSMTVGEKEIRPHDLLQLINRHRVVPIVPGDAVVTAELREMSGSRWHKHMRRIR